MSLVITFNIGKTNVKQATLVFISTACAQFVLDS